MRSFYLSSLNEWQNGFQRHHIIPVAVLNDRVLRRKFKRLERFGFAPRNFTINGILLPCTEEAARQFKMPMHRGPHKYYNDLVYECVGLIFKPFDFLNAPDRELRYVAAEIAKLQATLKALLRQNNVHLRLSNQDPAKRDVINDHLDMAAAILASMLEDRSNMVPTSKFEPAAPNYKIFGLCAYTKVQ